jgi:hypothetical protein
MLVQLVQGPEGSPNFCFGLYGRGGVCVEFIQSDWEYAPLACSLGWAPCECGATDGTVDCAHRTTSAMLAEAYDYLAERDGEWFTIEE